MSCRNVIHFKKSLNIQSHDNPMRWMRHLEAWENLVAWGTQCLREWDSSCINCQHNQSLLLVEALRTKDTLILSLWMNALSILIWWNISLKQEGKFWGATDPTIFLRPTFITGGMLIINPIIKRILIQLHLSSWGPLWILLQHQIFHTWLP